jgi:hypothetical protein
MVLLGNTWQNHANGIHLLTVCVHGDILIFMAMSVIRKMLFFKAEIVPDLFRSLFSISRFLFLFHEKNFLQQLLALFALGSVSVREEG